MATNVSVWLYAADTVTYLDVTSYVIGVNSNRGKSRALDYYEPGSVSVVFNNYNRVFDPTNLSSPLVGYLRPKQRIFVHINSSPIFSGLVDEWSFTYDVNGQATATVQASEKSSLFANQNIPAQTFPSELSGARVNRILDSSSVQWPSSYGARSIDSGTQLLDADTLTDSVNVLDYLRQIEQSEQGQLYISGQDNLVFDDNSVGLSTVGGYPYFSDVPGQLYNYESIDVIYTSQLLYNKIQLNTWDGVSGFTDDDVSSQSSFGIYQLNVDGILYTNLDRLINLSSLLLTRYRAPEYRINSVTVNFYNLDYGQQQTALSVLSLNGFAQAIFTPNSTGSSITQFVRIIGINHDVTSGSHLVTFNLESLKYPGLVLDDNEFGKLDYYSLGL
jgi:hypothetical protein